MNAVAAVRTRSRITWLVAAVAFLAAAAATFALDRISVPVPTREEATVALGRLLFFDHRLSRNGQISCSTCHDPAFAYTDRRKVSIGAGDAHGVNSPTLANVGSRSYLRAAGLAATLEEQARGAILDRGEIGAVTVAAVEERIGQIDGYRPMFDAAFGDPEASLDRIVTAIAAFERTLVSADSDYDRFVAGTHDLSDAARHGAALFFGRARCSLCHAGRDFTDEQFHVTGSTKLRGQGLAGFAAVSGKESDRGALRTPTLREVARTAPYFHFGELSTLREVVDFYDAGGRPHPNRDEHIRPLGLTEADKTALIAFLGTLSGRAWVDSRPLVLPR